MGKIYTSDNYIIVEEGGIIKPFPKRSSEYGEHSDHFSLKKYPNIDVVDFKFTAISDWYDDTGTVSFTTETLRTFLRQNTGFDVASGSSGADFIKQDVDYYSELIDGKETGDLAHVNFESGSKWLPGSLGGSFYPAGWYVWQGGEWISDSESFANQFYINQLLIAEKANQVDLDTVSSNLSNEASTRASADIALQNNIDNHLNEISQSTGENIGIGFTDFETIDTGEKLQINGLIKSNVTVAEQEIAEDEVTITKAYLNSLLSPDIIYVQDNEFQNGFENFTSSTTDWLKLNYYKQGNKVFLQGFITGGTTNGTILTLPTGYIANSKQLVYAFKSDGNALRIDVETDGTVAINGDPGFFWTSINVNISINS